MPNIDINFADGRSQRRRLSRRNPIVIGSNPISDVHIDDESIAPIHCRVLWNGKAYEVAAAAEDGVDVNGVLVVRKRLADGDVIRIGDADLVVSNGSKEGSRKREVAAQAAGTSSPVADPEPVAEAKKAPPPGQQTEEFSEADWAALAGEDDDAVHFDEFAPPAAPETRAPKGDVVNVAEPREEKAAKDDAVASEPVGKPVLLDDKPVKEATKPDKSSDSGGKARWTRLPAKKRPGEQDILTSPLVLGLGGFALCLLLASGAIWLLIGRESADRLYEAAVADRRSGRYTQAISKFERFVLTYPNDGRNVEAQHVLGLVRIEQHSTGASPDFEKALKAFDAFVRANRDDAAFDSLTPKLASIAREMASDATEAAIRSGNRDYLAPAERAGKLYTRYGGEKATSDEAQERLEAEYHEAVAAVRKQEYFEKVSAKIETAVAKQDFTTAYQARNELLTRYPNFRENRRISDLLARTLESESALIKPVAEPIAKSLPAKLATGQSDSLALIGHTQARVGEKSDGRIVIAVARDQLVGLDVITGEPLWRATLGLNTPFFPVEVDASVAALLAFDATRLELMLLAREDGGVLWRTSIGRLAAGPPRVAQGQIDLVTTDGHLVRLALETGEPLAEVSFPQPLTGSPVITNDGENLIVFGEQATAYVLDFRTLEARSVSFVGHPAGSLATSPQRLGKLIFVFENDELESARIRALSFDAESGELTTVATERVDGMIRTAPMPRGNVLFVPSLPERITAFSVSDDPGQPALTRLAGVQITKPREIPTYLMPGPDGLVWAAGSALRKLKLVAEDLTILPGTLAAGRHTQPVQKSGTGLFVARRLPSSRAIYVSQADRETMSGSWRCVLGADVIAHAAAENELTVLTEAGQVGIVTSSAFEAKSFLDTRLLPGWEEDSAVSLEGISLSQGSALVWQTGEPALLWRINPTTAVAAPRTLPAAPQTAPIALEGGLVFPLPGKLVWLASGGAANVAPFLLPVTGEPDKAPVWQSLARLDERTFAALSDDGTLRVVRRRDEPEAHLAEVASAKLEEPVRRPLAAISGELLLAVGNRVEKRDPAGLRPVAEREFSTPLQSGPWVVGSLVVVQTAEGIVTALDGETFKPLWQCPLESALAGAPLAIDPESSHSKWLVAGQDGTILVVEDDETNNGSIKKQMKLSQRLMELGRLGGEPVAYALGGVIVKIGPMME